MTVSRRIADRQLLSEANINRWLGFRLHTRNTGRLLLGPFREGKSGTKLNTLFGIIAALDLDLKLAPRSKGGADLGEIF